MDKSTKHYHRVQLGSSGTQHAEIPCDCCDELRAENERLTERAAYAERVWKELGASREQLQAENERLRAALEKIEAGYGQRLSAAELASIARQAL